MKIAQKRDAGEILCRDGISDRIILIAKSIATGGRKNAIIQAGRMAELVEASTYDDYWNSKAYSGRSHERALMLDLITGFTTKEKLTSENQNLKRSS